MQVPKRDRLHRFRRLNQILSVVPYGIGAAAIAMATRSSLVQALFRVQQKRLAFFLKENGLEVDQRQVFARYLTTNGMTIWRLLALSRCSKEVFEQWVSMKGYETFAQLREQGRPVVLYNSHYGAGKFFLLALMRQGHIVHSIDRFDLFSFFNIRTPGKLVSINLGDPQGSFMLKQVFRARKVLQEGGILHIAGDGTRGLSGRAIPFFGRKRQFPASVAEFALATGATVVPTFGVLRTDGRVQLDFLPALEMPDAQLAHEDRVMHIIKQYASLLQKHWVASPGSIWKNEMKVYSDLPMLESPVFDQEA